MTSSGMSESGTASDNQKQFGKFASIFWPIHRSEVKLFLFITGMHFSILFVQNLIRAIKDSLVNTIIGTETISFLKFWGVLPASFLVTLLYVKLVTKMRSATIFYSILGAFIMFFMFFAYIILPNYDLLHLSKETTSLMIKRAPHMKWFIMLLSHWGISIFYIIAELWPTTVFALLFWQFVNAITNVEQSKRFYIFFGLFGQTGLYFAGQTLSHAPKLSKYLSNIYNFPYTSYVLYVQIIMTIVILFCITTLTLLWILNNRVLSPSIIENMQFKAQKQNLSIIDSLKLVLRSKYIMLITTLLICYGVAINLVEGPWKAMAAKVYTDPESYGMFIGRYLSYSGIATVALVILGSNIIRYLGWLTAAMMTPIILFITGMSFFMVANFEINFLYLFSAIDPLVFSVYVGMFQNVFSKSTKYTLFDATKEMSYVPLDYEIKTKGKAAADVLGTKLGKSLSALAQSTIFILLPQANFQSISSTLMFIFVFICVLWIWTIVKLNKEYTSLVSLTKDT